MAYFKPESDSNNVILSSGKDGSPIYFRRPLSVIYHRREVLQVSSFMLSQRHCFILRPSVVRQMCYRTHTQHFCGHTSITHHHCLPCIAQLQRHIQSSGHYSKVECQCRRFGRLIVKQTFLNDICDACKWSQVPDILKASIPQEKSGKIRSSRCNFGCGCSGFVVKRKRGPSSCLSSTPQADKERNDKKYQPYRRVIVHHGRSAAEPASSGEDDDETIPSSTSGSLSSSSWTTPSIHISPPPGLPTSSVFDTLGLLSSSPPTASRPHLNILRTSNPPSQDALFAAPPLHLSVKENPTSNMAPRSSLNIMTPASPSPSPPRPLPGQKPLSLPPSPRVPPSTPRKVPKVELATHKQPLSTPRSSPGRKVEPASLYLPALRPPASTPSRPSISQTRSFSSASPKDQEILIARKIDNTLERLFEKVDEALSSPSTTNKTGDVPLVRLKVDEFPADSVPLDTADENTPLYTALDNSPPWSALKSSPRSGEGLPIIEEEVPVPIVRTKKPVEEAVEIRRNSGFTCCPSSPQKPDNHAPSRENQNAIATTKMENMAPKRAPAATAGRNKKGAPGDEKKTRLQKEQQRWMCKAHKNSPPEDDRELYVCMRCTRNRTNKSGTGRRP